MGGKKDKSEGLGRALVRQHNQKVRESKETGRALRLQNRRILESVIDVSDIDAVLEKAEEADRIYSLDNPFPDLHINLYVSIPISTFAQRQIVSLMPFYVLTIFVMAKSLAFRLREQVLENLGTGMWVWKRVK